MKILVVCQYYTPEPFRIADICEALVRRGHEVLVLTGVPNYPEGQIYAGYKHGKKRDEIINGVRVHRCFTIARRKSLLFRLLNYYSYAISSTIYASRMKEEFDVVLVNQLSPVMMARAATVYKKKHNKKMTLYCLDPWPENLAIVGIRSGSFLYRVFHKVSQFLYKKADKIAVSSRSFSPYFAREFGISDTVYLPQYAETVFDAKQCRKEPNGTVDLMFAGNVGIAQSVETILHAARKTADIENLRWHIVGDGSELARMRELSRSLGLTNVIFHGRQPLESMPRYYAMADAMLVTMQKDAVLSMTLPGKVQTYMAAGKPILGSVDGEAAAAIAESACGLCCAAEDADALARIAWEFVQNGAHQPYGSRALAYYNQHFVKDRVIDGLIDLLQ